MPWRCSKKEKEPWNFSSETEGKTFTIDYSLFLVFETYLRICVPQKRKLCLSTLPFMWKVAVSLKINLPTDGHFQRCEFECLYFRGRTKWNFCTQGFREVCLCQTHPFLSIVLYQAKMGAWVGSLVWNYARSAPCIALPYFFTLYHKRYGFRKNVIELKICVLVYRTNFMWHSSYF
jgi:hypothetical protein